MSCSRQQCTIQNTPTNTFNEGQFAYNMKIGAHVYPGSSCLGSGAGLGRQCSWYGPLRSTIAATGDPTLWQRSYISSGCAPTKFNTLPDAPGPVDYSRYQNKGDQVNSYHTRNWSSNTESVVEHDMSQRMMQARSWSDGFAGIDAVGGNIPSRENARCSTNSRFRQTQNQTNSYGSYGVVDTTRKYQ